MPIGGNIIRKQLARGPAESEAPWFWRDLICAYAPFITGPTGSKLIDLGPRGIHMNAGASFSNADWGTFIPHFQNLPTWALDVNSDSFTGAAAEFPLAAPLAFAAGSKGYTAATRYLFVLDNGTDPFWFCLQQATGGGRTVCGGTSSTQNATNSADTSAAVMDPGYSMAANRLASGVTPEMWINLSPRDEGNTSVTSPGTWCQLGARAGSALWVERLFYFYLWKRNLTPNEFTMIHLDPAIGFRRRRRWKAFVPPAPGGDPEAGLVKGKLIRGGLLTGNRLVG